MSPSRAHTPILLPPMGQVPPGTTRLHDGERLASCYNDVEGARLQYPIGPKKWMKVHVGLIDRNP